MASQSNNTNKRGRPTKAELERRRREEAMLLERQRRAQVTAMVLLAVGLLFTALSVIPGQNVWNALRSVLFGLFGVCGYLVGPALIYIAVRCAYEKLPAVSRSIKMAFLLLCFAGALYLFGKQTAPDTFGAALKFLYTLGADRVGGGVLSLPLGWVLQVSCGGTAAKVLVCILGLVVVLIITGKTVLDLADGVKKPIDTIREHQIHKREEAALAAEEEPDYEEKAEEAVSAGQPRFDIDIAIDGQAEVQKPQPEPVTPPAAEEIIEPFPISRNPVKKPAAKAKTKQNGPANPASRIDIPLGPDYVPAEPIFTEKVLNKQPTGPAVSVVSDVFEREDRIRKRFATFETEQSPSVDELIEKASGALPNEEPAQDATPFAIAPQEPEPEKAPLKPEYRFPPLYLLQKAAASREKDIAAELRASADRLVATLESFGVRTHVVNIARGPAVTRYELQPEAGVRLSRIVNLADDIALNLAASGVRIEAPIPGKAAVGIEVPNKTVNIVNLRSVIESDAFQKAESPLTFALGMGIGGEMQVGDISKMPHLLIAGSTGMGKSVCINSMITSIVYKSKPEDVQMILIDPKIVEFKCYSGLPHLYIPVVTDPHKAAGALGSAVSEMLKRYRLFAEYGSRNIGEYNDMVDRDFGPDCVLEEGEERPEKKPRLVIIIDELADLMMTSPKEVEDSICRIAQMGRAAGIHLVVATQRPSVDVITGLIKNNIPTRIAFAVSSQVDSRTILDGSGAEKLLGRGDMLFQPVGSPKPSRIQGCYVSEEEVSKVVDFLKRYSAAQYNEQFIKEMEEKSVPEKERAANAEQDEMLEDAIEAVVEAGQASTSFLQRRLKLGYARAARIMDEMEQMGIIGPQDGSKPRAVLMTRQMWQERMMSMHNED